MSDTNKPAGEPAPAAPKYPRAKIGQDDSGHVVTSAGDEPMSGTIADIVDGDEPRRKRK